jgi:hypothetical protein
MRRRRLQRSIARTAAIMMIATRPPLMAPPGARASPTTAVAHSIALSRRNGRWSWLRHKGEPSEERVQACFAMWIFGSDIAPRFLSGVGTPWTGRSR